MFSRVSLKALGETIAHSATELVERAAKRRTIDWIGDVAAPLAMRVMLRMMAIPERDRGHWRGGRENARGCSR